MSEVFLLDTCAAIWLSSHEKISGDAANAISSAWQKASLYVSTVTAWEMGILLARGRLTETKPPTLWYESFKEESHVVELSVCSDIFIASCFLPQLAHKDSIDRILIATARERDLTVITRDRAILAYGAAGHVKTLAC
jgi:PIN domain nuclease of toxin-antitoxin system